MATTIQQQLVNSVPLLDVSRGMRPLKQEILQAVTDIIDAGCFVGGPYCQTFEQAAAEYCQTEFAIGCASGSDALLLALMALEIGPGDEVICPSFTFFATVSAIDRVGASCVFADIEPATFNLDPDVLPSLISDRTRAIIPVHLFGQCCDMDPILQLAAKHQLAVIEDAAQAIGATYKHRAAGSLGDVGCFSFYPTKNLGACGDGGLLTTNRPEVADRLRLLANHGMRPRYHHQEIGLNSRLDALQAAILTIKLSQLSPWIEARHKNATTYRQRLQDIETATEIILPTTLFKNSRHVWNQFTIRILNGRRDEVRDFLSQSQIGTEIYYPIPQHLQPCFAHYGYTVGSLPETERAASEVLSLPIFPELTLEELDFVAEKVSEAVLAG